MTVTITLPVARLVIGNPYDMSDKDWMGEPLVVKTGANKGQPTKRNSFTIAIPKGAEAAQGAMGWAFTDWGNPIWNLAAAAFPAAYQRPDFSWKIEDGDSAIPNKKGRKNCDTEGMPGHWIVRISSGYAPSVYVHDGKSWVHRQDPFVKTGYFIQVQITVDGNGQAVNPGVYLNPHQVAFQNYGPEIFRGPDPNAAGFAAPAATASTVPPAVAGPALPALPGAAAPMTPPVALPGAAAPMTPPVALPNSAAPMTPPVALPNSAAPMTPPVALPNSAAPVTPYPAIRQPVAPTVPGVPAPTAPPGTVGPVMTATAQAAGYTYEALKAAGWSDAQMIQHGYLAQ